MSIINRILIAFDLYEDYREESDQVPVEVRNAKRLISDKQTAQLILVGCGFEEYLRESFADFGSDAILKRRKYRNMFVERLKSIADDLKNQGYQVTTKFLIKRERYEQIVQLSEKHDVDLVVQHVNSNETSPRALSANSSWQLAKMCSRPLLLVKDSDWKKSPVLISVVDPIPSYHSDSPYGSANLDIAFQAKRQLTGSLHVVHAYSKFSWPFANSEPSSDRHKKALVELLATCRVEPESVHLVDKSPLYALLNYKEKLNPDIIVMDTSSKSRFTEAIISNSTKRVLDYLQTDLLIIKQGFQVGSSAHNNIGRNIEGNQNCSESTSFNANEYPKNTEALGREYS